MTYHSLSSERTDLLDRPRGPLLEAHAVHLIPHIRHCCSRSLFAVFRPMSSPRRPSTTLRRCTPHIVPDIVSSSDEMYTTSGCREMPGTLTIRGLHQTARTLLWRWMVYSRATTSSMALRPGLPPAAALGFFSCLVDIVGVG